MARKDIPVSLVKRLETLLKGDIEAMALYERELGLLDYTDNISEIIAINTKGGVWNLKIVLKKKSTEKNKDDSLLIITGRNTPRTWKNLNTLYEFVARVCPKTNSFKIIMGKSEEEDDNTNS